jgi:hypothetical protein
MFQSYDHHQAEKYIATLGILNWQRIRCFIISYIIVIAYILLCIVLILRCQLTVQYLYAWECAHASTEIRIIIYIWDQIIMGE